MEKIKFVFILFIVIFRVCFYNNVYKIVFFLNIRTQYLSEKKIILEEFLETLIIYLRFRKSKNK